MFGNEKKIFGNEIPILGLIFCCLGLAKKFVKMIFGNFLREISL